MEHIVVHRSRPSVHKFPVVVPQLVNVWSSYIFNHFWNSILYVLLDLQYAGIETLVRLSS